MKTIFMSLVLLFTATSFAQSIRKAAYALDGTKCKVLNKNPYRAAFATITKGKIVFAARNRQPIMVFQMSAVKGKKQLYGFAKLAPRGHRYVQMQTGLLGTKATFGKSYNRKFKKLSGKIGTTLRLKCDPFVPVLRRISGTKCLIAKRNWNNPYRARYMVLRGNKAIFLNRSKVPVMQYSLFAHKGIVNMFGHGMKGPKHPRYVHLKGGLTGTKVSFSNGFSRKKMRIGQVRYSMKMKCQYPKR